AMKVARRATRGLDEAGCGAEVPFFVGVEDGDHGNFGQVQAFTQKIDTDQDIELAFAECAQNFDPFDSVDFAVEVPDVDADVPQIIGKFFGGACGQGGDENAFFGIHAFADFVDQIVDLPFERLQ